MRLRLLPTTRQWGAVINHLVPSSPAAFCLFQSYLPTHRQPSTPPHPSRSPLLTRSSLPTQFPRGAFLFPPAARPRCLSACWSASDSITLSPPPCPSVTLLVQAHVYLWCGAEERVPLGLENPLNAPRHALLFSFTHFHSVTQTPLVYRRVELLPLTPPPTPPLRSPHIPAADVFFISPPLLLSF